MYNDLLLNRIAAAPVEDPDEHIQELIDEIEELKSLTSPEAQALIRDLRPRLVTDDVYEEIEEHASFGDRMADKLATLAGSWRFIICFSLLMAVWLVACSTVGVGQAPTVGLAQQVLQILRRRGLGIDARRAAHPHRGQP